MCGICGVWNYASGEPVDRDVLQRMTARLSHRGPDDGGDHFDDRAGIGLGHRRLSIVDLTPAGRQPMSNEDGSIWTVFNGAIYDFAELRRDLEGRGHRFRSRTDTEVLVHAYEEQGVDCIAALNGMFGLAIWDAVRRRLVLARDRLGEKPLYYCDDGKRLLFASELKALLAHPDLSRDLSWGSVGEFLALGYVAADRCILRDVRKLPAGHRLVCDDGAITVTRYWDWLPAFHRIDEHATEDDWTARIRDTLRACVQSRMTSDAPLGAFLSGGLDSSSVVAAMASVGAQPVRTFSIGFADPRFSELEYAREVALALGTDHRELVVEPESVPDLVPRLMRQYDEPFADSSALPTYYLSRLAREHVTVCLSGDGGDEACAGYDRYVQAEREAAVDQVPPLMRRLLLAPFAALPVGVPGSRLARRLGLDVSERYLDHMRLMPREQVRALLTPDAARRIGNDGTAAFRDALDAAADLDPLSRMQYADGRVYLADDILVKVDRASMLNALEVRCPLLDRRFLELMASIPARLRTSARRGKQPLRAAMRGILPERILQRRKAGFAVPLSAWVRGDLGDFVRDVLLDRRTGERGIFRPAALARLVRAQESRARLTPHMWAALVFELWCRNYLDERH